MYWAIQFLGEEEVIGSKEYHNDQVSVYAGLYGLPSYCVWWAAPDKTKRLFLGKVFTLMLFSGKERYNYLEHFVIKEATYDLKKHKYRIYAQSTVYENLANNNDFMHNVFTNNKSDPLNGKQVLEKILPTLNVEPVFQEPLEYLVGYVSINFDRDFSALDLITKICKENKWEFYLARNKVFISQEFIVKDSYVTVTMPDWELTKYVDFIDFKTVSLPLDTCEPGAIYQSDSRVIWVKFYVGQKIGGQMTFCCYNLRSYLPEETFVNTLTGLPRELARDRIYRSQKPLIIGKIFDTPDTDNLNKYEAKTFGGDIRNRTKDLNTLEFKTVFVGDDEKQVAVKDVKISTPYAGNGVGVQYPQEESHRILMTPNDEREYSIVGPAYFGNDDTVPKRNNVQDYRLQLPNGWCMYVSASDGKTIIQPKNAEAGSVPSDSEDAMQIVLDPENGEIVFKKDNDTQLKVASNDEVTLTKDANNKITISNDGKITIDCESDLTVNGGGAIDVNGTGEVTINGTAVKMQGGGNKLSHSDHVHGYQHLHKVGNMGIPIPDMQHIGVGTNTDAHLAVQGTTTTEAE